MLEDPGLPTLSTLLPELEYESWLGVLGPHGLPPRVLERLNREIREIATSPEISARIHALGAMPRSSTPESFAPAVSARSRASRALSLRAGFRWSEAGGALSRKASPCRLKKLAKWTRGQILWSEAH